MFFLFQIFSLHITASYVFIILRCLACVKVSFICNRNPHRCHKVSHSVGKIRMCGCYKVHDAAPERSLLLKGLNQDHDPKPKPPPFYTQDQKIDTIKNGSVGFLSLVLRPSLRVLLRNKKTPSFC